MNEAGRFLETLHNMYNEIFFLFLVRNGLHTVAG